MTSEQLMEVNKGIEEWGLKNVENIILIKKGATNGEMIKALYPNNSFEEYEDERVHVVLMWIDDNLFTEYDYGWWNMSYKGDTEIHSDIF